MAWASISWPCVIGQWRPARFFPNAEVSGASKVCVIGYTLVTKLFGNDDPLGQQIRVKNIPFEVVGVLARKGANLVGQDQDDILLMPYSTVRKRLEGSAFANIGLVLVSARSEELSPVAEEQIRRLLLERHQYIPGWRQSRFRNSQYVRKSPMYSTPSRAL